LGNIEKLNKITKAPFTDEQIKNLNEYQKLDIVHKFTCGNDHNGERTLIATDSGWVCPTCDYKQDWCHTFMLNVESIKDNWNNSPFGKLKPI
jgi:hypothetical protein